MSDLSKEHAFTGMSTTIPVPDVIEAMQWYVARLGFKPYFYVKGLADRSGVRLGRTEICFCHGEALECKEHWIYLDVSNPDELFDRYKDEGIEIAFEPKTQLWGSRDFGIKDLNGYLIIFGDERDETRWKCEPSEELADAIEAMQEYHNKRSGT